MYTEYQIKAAIINTLNRAKSELGITGFQVLSRNPPNQMRTDDMILVDKIQTSRQGFQGREYRGSEEEKRKGNASEVMCWLEETTYQFSFCKARRVTDDINTETSDDCLEKIMAWFNSSRGAAYMRSGESGVFFAPIHTKNKRTRVYTDENESYQMEESFDFRFQVIQELEFTQKLINGYGIKDYSFDENGVIKLSEQMFDI